MNAMTIRRISRSNGVLPLPSRWMGLFPDSHIHGGPFRYAPTDMAGLCLLEEFEFATMRHRHMPIADFSVPADDAHVTAALKGVFRTLLRGQPVYVGCAGGWGRTGLMLALIAKVAGQEKPVAYVREHYTPRAVETAAQECYVASFDVRPIQSWLRWAAVRHVHHRLLGR